MLPGLSPDVPEDMGDVARHEDDGSGWCVQLCIDMSVTVVSAHDGVDLILGGVHMRRRPVAGRDEDGQDRHDGPGVFASGLDEHPKREEGKRLLLFLHGTER